MNGSGGTRPAKLLVVDDDDSVLESLARTLRLEGYEVITASNGDTALREVVRQAPDAVIVDLRMSQVDGLEFLRRLRSLEERRATPVAIVTGDYYIDEAASGELRALGADVYFKPVWIDDFKKIADLLLRRRSGRGTE